MAQPATRSLGRLSEIAQVMVRHGFGYFLEAHRLTDLLPGRSAEARIAAAAAANGSGSARGQHLRELLDELGPTFVKFGQLLSTRRTSSSSCAASRTTSGRSRSSRPSG
jgi:ubiquinone biosynthesis protein